MSKGKMYSGIDKNYLKSQLINIRLEKHLSSVEAAKRIGISPSAYSKYETGKILYPTAKFIHMLLSAYPDKTEDDFIKYVDTTSDGTISILNGKIREWMQTQEGEIYIMEAYVKWLKDNKLNQE